MFKRLRLKMVGKQVFLVDDEDNITAEGWIDSKGRMTLDHIHVDLAGDRPVPEPRIEGGPSGGTGRLPVEGS